MVSMIRWQCNLCNMQLPDDELIDVRKKRHESFHVDESIGTDKPRRNWTFGSVIYTIVNEKIDGDDI